MFVFCEHLRGADEALAATDEPNGLAEENALTSEISLLIGPVIEKQNPQVQFKCRCLTPEGLQSWSQNRTFCDKGLHRTRSRAYLLLIWVSVSRVLMEVCTALSIL